MGALHHQKSHHEAHHAFVHGDLLHQFKKGGVLERAAHAHHNNVIDFPELSIQHILRTENHLGHAIDEAHKIDFTHLNRTSQQGDHIDHEIFQYSQKETGREQHEGSADANVSTDTGHMKKGILDPDAFKTIEAKRTRRTLIHLQELHHQLTALEAINHRIHELQNHIRDLDRKLEHLNHEFHNINEAMDFLDHNGDLNSGSSRATRAKRALNAAASHHGIAEGMYKHADGTYDNEAAKKILAEEQHDKIKEIIHTQEERLATTAELMKAHNERYKISEAAINNPETSNAEKEQLRHLQESSSTSIETLSKQAEETSSDLDEMKAMMAKNKARMQALYAPKGTTDPATANTSLNAGQTTENTVSFAAAAEGDSAANVIKSSFNEASDPTLAQNKLESLPAPSAPPEMTSSSKLAA